MSQRLCLELAIKQIESARSYMLNLLEGIDQDDWFRQPIQGITHIAWQVGHLAVAQYGLCLFRLRGRRLTDSDLMSSTFRKQFGKSSTADPDPGNNPTAVEIRSTLQRVHAQALIELPQYTAEQLAIAVDEPYAAVGTKLGALLFCAHHEMLHAGQIGLLRRLLGYPPIR